MTVEPSPAASVKVTCNDPGASGIAATLGSENSNTSVLLESTFRAIAPTPTTVGAANTGPGVGVGARLIVGLGGALAITGVGLGGALATTGVGLGGALATTGALAEGVDGCERNTTATTTAASARAPTSTNATTVRKVRSLTRLRYPGVLE